MDVKSDSNSEHIIRKSLDQIVDSLSTSGHALIPATAANLGGLAGMLFRAQPGVLCRCVGKDACLGGCHDYPL